MRRISLIGTACMPNGYSSRRSYFVVKGSFVMSSIDLMSSGLMPIRSIFFL